MKLAADSFRVNCKLFCFNHEPRTSMYGNKFTCFDSKTIFEIKYKFNNKFFIKDFRLL